MLPPNKNQHALVNFFKELGNDPSRSIQRPRVYFHVISDLTITLNGIFMADSNCKSGKIKLAFLDERRLRANPYIIVFVKTVHWSMLSTGQTKVPEVIHMNHVNSAHQSTFEDFKAFCIELRGRGIVKEIHFNNDVAPTTPGHSHEEADKVSQSHLR
jgi:hypothetical protein